MGLRILKDEPHVLVLGQFSWYALLLLAPMTLVLLAIILWGDFGVEHPRWGYAIMGGLLLGMGFMVHVFVQHTRVLVDGHTQTVTMHRRGFFPTKKMVLTFNEITDVTLAELHGEDGPGYRIEFHTEEKTIPMIGYYMNMANQEEVLRKVKALISS